MSLYGRGFPPSPARERVRFRVPLVRFSRSRVISDASERSGHGPVTKSAVAPHGRESGAAKVVVAQKRKAEAAAAAVSESLQILDAAKAPNFACFATEALFDIGMGWVVAARYLPSGSVAASFFLVDAWFLGVKDAFFMVSSRHKFEEQMKGSRLRTSAEAHRSARRAPIAARCGRLCGLQRGSAERRFRRSRVDFRRCSDGRADIHVRKGRQARSICQVRTTPLRSCDE